MNNKKEANQEISLSRHWGISYLAVLLEGDGLGTEL